MEGRHERIVDPAFVAFRGERKRGRCDSNFQLTALVPFIFLRVSIGATLLSFL